MRMPAKIAAQINPQLYDAAMRITDVINERRSNCNWDELQSKCMAFKLEDGTGDGILYDNKRDAVRHQHGNEKQYVYIYFRNLAGGANAREIAIHLAFVRKAYQAGMNLVDPDDQFGGKEPILTTGVADRIASQLYRPHGASLWTPGHAR